MTVTPVSARRAPALWATLLAAVLTTLSLASAAAPGAHGPSGEHLDGPGSAGMRLGARQGVAEHGQVLGDCQVRGNCCACGDLVDEGVGQLLDRHGEGPGRRTPMIPAAAGATRARRPAWP